MQRLGRFGLAFRRLLGVGKGGGVLPAPELNARGLQGGLGVVGDRPGEAFPVAQGDGVVALEVADPARHAERFDVVAGAREDLLRDLQRLGIRGLAECRSELENGAFERKDIEFLELRDDGEQGLFLALPVQAIEQGYENTRIFGKQYRRFGDQRHRSLGLPQVQHLVEFLHRALSRHVGHHYPHHRPLRLIVAQSLEAEKPKDQSAGRASRLPAG